MTHGEDLKNKPLVEAIFELRWRLSGMPPGPVIDPNYKVLVGSLFVAMRTQYPHHEQLATVNIPDEFVPYVIQHRFRRTVDGYPLVQLGPGIFAVNETAGYSWRTYLPRVLSATQTLRATYAAAASDSDLVPSGLSLRFINAVPFDPSKDDVLDYLRRKLKVEMGYPPALFKPGVVEKSPSGVAIGSSHRLMIPAGVAQLRFSTAEAGGIPQLLWEMQLQSNDEDVVSFDQLGLWLNQAHDIAREWFYVLIEGDLEAEFNK